MFLGKRRLWECCRQGVGELWSILRVGDLSLSLASTQCVGKLLGHRQSTVRQLLISCDKVISWELRCVPSCTPCSGQGWSSQDAFPLLLNHGSRRLCLGVWGMATLDMYRNCRDGPSQGGKAAALTQSEVLQPCKRQTCLGLQTLHVSPTSGSAAARERPRTGKADGTILLEDDVCGF